MKRLKLLICIFCLAVSLPLAFVIVQTYTRLDQEELAQLRFFSEAIFDNIEQDLARLVQREEKRAVDEYNFSIVRNPGGEQRSPLSEPPGDAFIIGYLQNNPDGSFQTPMVADLGRIPAEKRNLMATIKTDNDIFNRRKFSIVAKTPVVPAPQEEATDATSSIKAKTGFADRFLLKREAKPQKSYLGQQSVRKEAISVEQALNVAREDETLMRSRPRQPSMASEPAASQGAAAPPNRAEQLDALPSIIEERAEAAEDSDLSNGGAFQVEVAPLQSVHIRDGRYFIFRRIVINNQIYRQGFLLDAQTYMQHLASVHFEQQPMAGFARLNLHATEDGTQKRSYVSGRHVAAATFTTDRIFPAPFDFLTAALQSNDVPSSPARRALSIALAALGLVMLLGLVAIYKSTLAVVNLSERRSQFVSSVTHELKTPLTNIRMYIEMLEQGIAATPEREQDYLRILGSESARLSRLINNVLELAKLEQKQRHFDMRKDRIQEVLAEVTTIMAHKLEQEGFQLTISDTEIPAFVFDREVMIQVFINLIENSIKFGRSEDKKEISIGATMQHGEVHIFVADSGPGIPRHALKKIFTDFYRVDNNLTRTTGGTGIGLSLVHKFVTAMGGTIQAENNAGGGCTISIHMPASSNST